MWHLHLETVYKVIETDIKHVLYQKGLLTTNNNGHNTNTAEEAIKTQVSMCWIYFDQMSGSPPICKLFCKNE